MSEKCNCQCCVIWRKYEKRWKAKIAKLETELESLMNAPMTVKHYKKIKADEVHEMARKSYQLDTELGDAALVLDMFDCASKLEGKDE